MNIIEKLSRRHIRNWWRDFVHVATLVGCILTGWSWGALAWLGGSYAVRMFAVTAGYHRYYSHRSYKTSRAFQFVLALFAMSSAMRGVLWWAAHHRHHHKNSDGPKDIHSPRQRGFWYSHAGWFQGDLNEATDMEIIKDFAKYPELRWLNRHDLLVALAWAPIYYLLGGATALFFGYFLGLIVVWHITFCVNSVAHIWGSRRYNTDDDSRNNPVLALLTFGEGWHNNHHHYQRSTRQGFYWWEIDITWMALKLFEALHLVKEITAVPDDVRELRPQPASSSSS